MPDIPNTPDNPGPETRVCPECGNVAGERPFCDQCGLNLAAVERLPTRSEWEAARSAAASAPVREPSFDSAKQEASVGGLAPASGAEPQPADGGDRSGWQWIRQHRVFAGAAGVGIVAAIGAIIAVSSGGGSFDPVSAENSVALYVAGASNLHPGDASCSLASTVGPGVYQYSCTTTVAGVDFQTMDATYDSHRDINSDSRAVSISNYQTVNVPPGYTYDPSTGHYAPPGSG